MLDVQAVKNFNRLCSVARSMVELTWSPGHQESDWRWVLFQHLLEELDFCLGLTNSGRCCLASRDHQEVALSTQLLLSV